MQALTRLVLKHMQAFSDCLRRVFLMLTYVLWPFGKNFIFELVTHVRTRDYTILQGMFKLQKKTISNVKTFSLLQMNIFFCHFNFSHNRRNGFWTGCFMARVSIGTSKCILVNSGLSKTHKMHKFQQQQYKSSQRVSW